MNHSSTPPVGLSHIETLTVEDHLTVPHVSPAFPAFENMPPVFATAYLVSFIEATCIQALQPYLSIDQRTVGTHIDVSHCAATPIGMQITARVELIEVAGRRLQFQIECQDDTEVVSRGEHARVIIEAQLFIERTQKKAPRS